jgi:hypothetical protein
MVTEHQVIHRELRRLSEASLLVVAGRKIALGPGPASLTSAGQHGAQSGQRSIPLYSFSTELHLLSNT